MQVLVDATNRRVDVIEEGLDFAIRVRLPPLEDTDLAVRRLPVPAALECLDDWPTLAMASNNERYTSEPQQVAEVFLEIEYIHAPHEQVQNIECMKLVLCREPGRRPGLEGDL